LTVYTTDAKLQTDNNLTENAIRPIALGRKKDGHNYASVCLNLSGLAKHLVWLIPDRFFQLNPHPFTHNHPYIYRKLALCVVAPTQSNNIFS
jgi:site-specific recombinase XerC